MLLRDLAVIQIRLVIQISLVYKTYNKLIMNHLNLVKTTSLKNQKVKNLESVQNLNSYGKL